MSFLPPKEAPSEDTIRANYASLFTMQERETVADLLSRGKIDFVGAALEVENPERAYWLDKYLILKRPKAEELESAVQEEIRKWQADGNEIDSPKKADFWETRMKLERENKVLPDLKVALKELEEKKSLTKAELKAMLDEKGIEYDPTLKKSELSALLGIAEESTEDEL